MYQLRRTIYLVVFSTIGLLSRARPADAATVHIGGTGTPHTDTTQVGAHDFDFAIGTWKTNIRYLRQPAAGSAAWTDFHGTVVNRKVWNGRANLEEIEADGTAAHFEGMTLRLYDPSAGQWNLYWANSEAGALSQAMIGQFKKGRGEFYDQEMSNGKSVFVRNVYFDITPTSYRFEQASSADGGKTWKPNFTAALTRESRSETEVAAPPVSADASQHDFDWQFGSWKVHMSRLQHPLTSSSQWSGLDGTVVVQKVWNGRANLAEIRASGPSAHLEFLALRLYNPASHQWSLSFASSNGGVLSVPMFGEFKNGRGEFYDQEPFNGRTIWVRFVFSDVTENAGRDEQAFSGDGGKTWQVNWVNTHTRVKD